MSPQKDILRWGIRTRHTDKTEIGFKVEKVPLELVTPEEHRDQVSGDRGVAILREVTPDKFSIITTASSDYELVPHLDVLDAVESVFQANKVPYELYDIHTGGTAGNRMYVDYILPDYKVASNGDEFYPFVQVQNSYDRALAFGTVTGLYRVACSNGNLWDTRDMQFLRLFHIRESIDLAKLFLTIDQWLEKLVGVRQGFQRLLQAPLSETTIEDVLKKVLPVERDRQLFTEAGILSKEVEDHGQVEYALFNALTTFATHVMADPTVRKSYGNYDHARRVQAAISRQFFQTM